MNTNQSHKKCDFYGYEETVPESGIKIIKDETSWVTEYIVKGNRD